MRPVRNLLVAVVALVLTGALVGCSQGPASTEGATAQASDPVLTDRLESLDAAMRAWSDASSLAEAMSAAETARNLVTGPGVPSFGDSDGDGRIGGAQDGADELGLLPGPNGEASATDGVIDDAGCLGSDLLGGSWSDPAARWDEAEAAITAWRPDRNTFPSLAAHPLRVVGWASLTLETDDLDAALEYAGHARLHVDASLAALGSC